MIHSWNVSLTGTTIIALRFNCDPSQKRGWAVNRTISYGEKLSPVFVEGCHRREFFAPLVEWRPDVNGSFEPDAGQQTCGSGCRLTCSHGAAPHNSKRSP